MLLPAFGELFDGGGVAPASARARLSGTFQFKPVPWTTYVLWLIRTNGEMRFGQLKKQMPGISAKVLTERLRMLEEAGIILRVQEPVIPPRVTYSFTSRGHQLQALLDEINVIAMAWTGSKRKSADVCMAEKRLR